MSCLRNRIDQAAGADSNLPSSSLPQEISYDKLLDSKSQFRLLCIEYWSVSAPIVATLCTQYRTGSLSYDAISYTWGDSTLRNTIFLNGKPVRVRANCWYALWQARYHGATHIWIDALCINQDDIEEKNAQVAQMHMIFRQAKTVYCSLGDHTADSEWFCEQVHSFQGLRKSTWFPWMQRSLSFADFKESVLRAEANLSRFVTAYNNFCLRPYWNRLWILQEMVFGQRKKLWCGKHQIDFDKLTELCFNFPALVQKQGMLTLGDVEYFSRLASHSESGFFLSDAMPVKQPGFFSMLCAKQCSDPRDLFYGSIRITNLPLQIDYGKSTYQVAREALEILATSVDYGVEHWQSLSLAAYREDILRVFRRMEVTVDKNFLSSRYDSQENHQIDGITVHTGRAFTYRGRIGQLKVGDTGHLYLDTDEISITEAGKSPVEADRVTQS